MAKESGYFASSRSSFKQQQQQQQQQQICECCARCGVVLNDYIQLICGHNYCLECMSISVLNGEGRPVQLSNSTTNNSVSSESETQGIEMSCQRCGVWSQLGSDSTTAIDLFIQSVLIKYESKVGWEREMKEEQQEGKDNGDGDAGDDNGSTIQQNQQPYQYYDYAQQQQQQQGLTDMMTFQGSTHNTIVAQHIMTGQQEQQQQQLVIAPSLNSPQDIIHSMSANNIKETRITPPTAGAADIQGVNLFENRERGISERSREMLTEKKQIGFPSAVNNSTPQHSSNSQLKKTTHLSKSTQFIPTSEIPQYYQHPTTDHDAVGEQVSQQIVSDMQQQQQQSLQHFQQYPQQQQQQQQLSSSSAGSRNPQQFLRNKSPYFASCSPPRSPYLVFEGNKQITQEKSINHLISQENNNNNNGQPRQKRQQQQFLSQQQQQQQQQYSYNSSSPYYQSQLQEQQQQQQQQQQRSQFPSRLQTYNNSNMNQQFTGDDQPQQMVPQFREEQSRSNYQKGEGKSTANERTKQLITTDHTRERGNNRENHQNNQDQKQQFEEEQSQQHQESQQTYDQQLPSPAGITNNNNNNNVHNDYPPSSQQQLQESQLSPQLFCKHHLCSSLCVCCFTCDCALLCLRCVQTGVHKSHELQSISSDLYLLISKMSDTAHEIRASMELLAVKQHRLVDNYQKSDRKVGQIKQLISNNLEQFRVSLQSKETELLRQAELLHTEKAQGIKEELNQVIDQTTTLHELYNQFKVIEKSTKLTGGERKEEQQQYEAAQAFPQHQSQASLLLLQEQQQQLDQEQLMQQQQQQNPEGGQKCLSQVEKANLYKFYGECRRLLAQLGVTSSVGMVQHQPSTSSLGSSSAQRQLLFTDEDHMNNDNDTDNAHQQSQYTPRNDNLSHFHPQNNNQFFGIAAAKRVSPIGGISKNNNYPSNIRAQQMHNHNQLGFPGDQESSGLLLAQSQKVLSNDRSTRWEGDKNRCISANSSCRKNINEKTQPALGLEFALARTEGSISTHPSVYQLSTQEDYQQNQQQFELQLPQKHQGPPPHPVILSLDTPTSNQARQVMSSSCSVAKQGQQLLGRQHTKEDSGLINSIRLEQLIQEVQRIKEQADNIDLSDYTPSFIQKDKGINKDNQSGKKDVNSKHCMMPGGITHKDEKNNTNDHHSFNHQQQLHTRHNDEIFSQSNNNNSKIAVINAPTAAVDIIQSRRISPDQDKGGIRGSQLFKQYLDNFQKESNQLHAEKPNIPGLQKQQQNQRAGKEKLNEQNYEKYPQRSDINRQLEPVNDKRERITDDQQYQQEQQAQHAYGQDQLGQQFEISDNSKLKKNAFTKHLDTIFNIKDQEQSQAAERNLPEENEETQQQQQQSKESQVYSQSSQSMQLKQVNMVSTGQYFHQNEPSRDNNNKDNGNINGSSSTQIHENTPLNNIHCNDNINVPRQQYRQNEILSDQEQFSVERDDANNETTSWLLSQQQQDYGNSQSKWKESLPSNNNNRLFATQSAKLQHYQHTDQHESPSFPIQIKMKTDNNIRPRKIISFPKKRPIIPSSSAQSSHPSMHLSQSTRTVSSHLPSGDRLAKHLISTSPFKQATSSSNYNSNSNSKQSNLNTNVNNSKSSNNLLTTPKNSSIPKNDSLLETLRAQREQFDLHKKKLFYFQAEQQSQQMF